MLRGSSVEKSPPSASALSPPLQKQKSSSNDRLDVEMPTAAEAAATAAYNSDELRGLNAYVVVANNDTAADAGAVTNVDTPTTNTSI